MRSLMSFLVAGTLVVLSGCHTTVDPNDCGDCCFDVSKTGTVDRVGVVVACTKVDPKAYGGWNGYCPGTDVDANTVCAQLIKEKIPYTFLFNARATANNVTAVCKQAARTLKDGGLLFVYFSGHGGQYIDTNGEEADGQDETICLYDGQLRDDMVWNLLTSIPAERNIQVFMVTDCCNSGTNFRTPRNFAKSLGKRSSARSSKSGPRSVPNLCHWGGCGDGESSYGSNVGGSFTLTWKKTFGKGMTYRSTQAFITENISGQRPTYAILGNFNLDKKVFAK